MQEPHKILIIRLSSIGDILLATPLLRLLHRRFPQTQIDFVVKEAFCDLLRCHPVIHTLYTLVPAEGFSALSDLKRKLREQNYDLVIDIHNNWRSRYLCCSLGVGETARYRKYSWQRLLLITAKINKYPGVIPVHRRYLDAVHEWGIADDDEGLHMELDPSVQQKMQHWLRQNGYTAGQKQIGFAPGAGRATKRWPAESFAQLAECLIQRSDVRIWLFGDESDQTLAKQIRKNHPGRIVDATGHLSLMQTACAITALNGLISNDSGLMHLATAVDCPVLAIFGPTTREFGFFPQGSQSRVIEHESLKCRPCSAFGSHRCPKRHFRCMGEIGPLTVCRAAEDLFRLV